MIRPLESTNQHLQDLANEAENLITPYLDRFRNEGRRAVVAEIITAIREATNNLEQMAASEGVEITPGSIANAYHAGMITVLSMIEGKFS